MGYLFLTIAIISEVAGTAALKASEEFTRPIPSLIVVAGYAIAFVCLALTLRTIPVGIAYAIWAGCGIVLVALVSYALFGQKLDAPGHRRHRPHHGGRGGGQRLLGQRGALGQGFAGSTSASRTLADLQSSRRDSHRKIVAPRTRTHYARRRRSWIARPISDQPSKKVRDRRKDLPRNTCQPCGDQRARRMAGSHSQVWLMQAPPPQWLDAAAGLVEAVDCPVAQ